MSLIHTYTRKNPQNCICFPVLKYRNNRYILLPSLSTYKSTHISIFCSQVHVGDLGDNGAYLPDHILRGWQQDHAGNHWAKLLVPVSWKCVVLCRYFLCHQVSNSSEPLWLCVYSTNKQSGLLSNVDLNRGKQSLLQTGMFQYKRKIVRNDLYEKKCFYKSDHYKRR